MLFYKFKQLFFYKCWDSLSDCVYCHMFLRDISVQIGIGSFVFIIYSYLYLVFVILVPIGYSKQMRVELLT